MRSRIHPAWWIVIAGAAILAVNMGIRQTFGLFLPPVTRDLGVTREAFALSIALVNLIWGAGSPFAGALCDKFGAKWVVLGGTIFYVLGLLVMATSAGPEGLVLSGILIGLGVSGSGFTAVFGVVARAVRPEKQALALSIASMGSAVGQFIALPYAHVLLTDTGWITTLFILAATAAVMAPLGFAMSVRLTDGHTSETQQTTAATNDEQALGAALREAMTYPSFVLLTLGFFVCGFQIAAVATHLPAFIGDKGLDPSIGVIALTVVGLTNIAGTYLCGRAGDIFSKKVALTLLYLLRGVIFLGFLYLPMSDGLIIALSAMLGFLWLGTVPLTSGLIITFFGLRWLSMLYGIVFFSHQIGGFLGAWLGGVVFDVYQSYDILWWLSIGVSLLAAFCHLPIREAASPRLEDTARAAVATA